MLHTKIIDKVWLVYARKQEVHKTGAPNKPANVCTTLCVKYKLYDPLMENMHTSKANKIRQNFSHFLRKFNFYEICYFE